MAFTTKDWKDYPDTSTPITAAALEDLETRVTDYGNTYVTTSLPGSPMDGQEIYYAADASNGVIWHLRYRSAASGSYKWEFVGGSPLISEVDSKETTTSTSTNGADLSTVGPTLTVPLAGDYIFSYGHCYFNNGLGATCNAGVSAGTGNIISGTLVGGAASDGYETDMAHRSRLFTALTASQEYRMKYYTSAGTAEFSRRYLQVTPVRVG